MATTKKTPKSETPEKAVVSKRASAMSSKKSIAISIDLDALDKLYKKRYVVVLDGGDTKGGKVSIRDGDTKGGIDIRDGSGDTKGGPANLPKRKTPSPPSPAKKAPPKKA